MTDYLDLLLDERQEEDENEPFAWRRTGTGYRELRGEDGGQQTNRERTGAEQDGGQARVKRAWSQEVTGQKQAADPELQLAILERAVARGKAQQDARNRSREHVQAAQTAAGQDLRRSAAAVSGVQRELAGVLDAAFERDARRYDGPLGLF